VFSLCSFWQVCFPSIPLSAARLVCKKDKRENDKGLRKRVKNALREFCFVFFTPLFKLSCLSHTFSRSFVMFNLFDSDVTVFIFIALNMIQTSERRGESYRRGGEPSLSPSPSTRRHDSPSKRRQHEAARRAADRAPEDVHRDLHARPSVGRVYPEPRQRER